jgi:YidC/Oxa1 family membrane protein insertase
VRPFGITLWRELRDLLRLLMLPAHRRPIVFYSEDISSHIQFEGYLDELLNTIGTPVVYVTSAPDDPLFDTHHPLLSVYLVKNALQTWIPKVDSRVLVMTMPDIGTLHVQRPGNNTFCLHIFHSLNSIHEVYRRGAFDNFDGFFCAGPHHKLELSQQFERIGKPQPALLEVGYYKLDRISAAHQRYRKRFEDRTTIVLAPSWGRRNVLEVHGQHIVDRLLRLNVRVVVRPHPCFFQPIYPGGSEIVDAIDRRFADNPDVVIERSINSEDAFHEADLMISDYSGAAPEYALGTLRPVLYVDGPRKRMNPDAGELGLPTFEDTIRPRIGRVLKADHVADIEHAAADLLARRSEFADTLKQLRSEVIYNFGHSAEVGAPIIDALSKGRVPEREA